MTLPMDEQSYQQQARSELELLITALDVIAAENEEFEVELANDIVTLEFKDGAKYVINSHRAARQIWMAADANAWHFDPTARGWCASKSGAELWSVVGARLTGKLGRVVNLARPV
jgi:CyaY protein